MEEREREKERRKEKGRKEVKESYSKNCQIISESSYNI